MEYSNQMVQFKEFISHAKYPSLLSSGCIDMGRSEMDPELLLNGPPRSQIVLLEDLPSVQGEEATEVWCVMIMNVKSSELLQALTD